MADQLTADQKQALSGILDFVKQPINEMSDCSVLLYAAAGCGKTFLTRYIADKLRSSYTIAGVAPTHKARKVLGLFLNNNAFYTIKTMTVASLLGKMRNFSYIGTRNYTSTEHKLNLYDLFIIDETSMINDKDAQKILKFAFKHKKKLIFVGDKYQIPNPSQKFARKKGTKVAYRIDSCIFKIPHKFELTTNMRQRDSGNPIIPIYLELRDAIAKRREPEIDRTTRIMKSGTDNDIDLGVHFYTNNEEWQTQMAQLYMNTTEYHKIRVIAYTNDAVKSHNKRIRGLLGRGLIPEVGELLMGYNNIGFPEPYISNGQDYYVKAVSSTKAHRIADFTGLVGLRITIKETDTDVVSKIFIPDISSFNNVALLRELSKRAEKVNGKRSSKNDFKKYCELRNRLVFMENIYKYRGQIVGETQFRSDNPLLFRNTSEVIDYGEHAVKINKLAGDLSERYGDELLGDRLDDNKPFNDSEKLCDRFCIIEKDIDWGYAITSHKSQGSSYLAVFIDEPDFDKLKNHYNYGISCHVDTVKEKNQLKYVAYTRPSEIAYVYYKEIV